MTLHPVFADHHVHLGLVDRVHRLPRSGIGRVLDLGWSPEIATRIAPECPVEIGYAGCFLAAPGGYPSGRPWAPPGSVVEVRSAAHARDAVAEQRELGASVVKATMNADTGPVHPPEVLAALVAAAAPLPLVVHAEGEGMVRRALEAGASVLAHTPWTEPVPDDLVRACADAGQSWISTLTIHGHIPADSQGSVHGDPSGERPAALDRALANLRAFHDAGGRVLYGTDLGNGPLLVGLNLRELGLLRAAGLDDDEIVAALTDPWPGAGPAPVSRVRTEVPDGPGEDLLDRLARARVVRMDEQRDDP